MTLSEAIHLTEEVVKTTIAEDPALASPEENLWVVEMGLTMLHLGHILKENDVDLTGCPEWLRILTEVKLDPDHRLENVYIFLRSINATGKKLAVDAYAVMQAYFQEVRS